MVDVDATNGACGDHLEDGRPEGLGADDAVKNSGVQLGKDLAVRSPRFSSSTLLSYPPPFALVSGPVSRSKPTASSPRLPVLPCWKGSSFDGAAVASPAAYVEVAGDDSGWPPVLSITSLQIMYL